MSKSVKEKIAINEDKITKINMQIIAEENSIKKSKEKIKKYKSEKAKAERNLRTIKLSQLQDTLQGFGVQSVEDLNKFLEEYSSAENTGSTNE